MLGHIPLQNGGGGAYEPGTGPLSIVGGGALLRYRNFRPIPPQQFPADDGTVLTAKFLRQLLDQGVVGGLGLIVIGGGPAGRPAAPALSSAKAGGDRKEA